MARIRTVKPEFFRHRRLYLAEKETSLPLRLSYIGLWTVADREGRFKWEADELKLDCLPYDEVDFSRVLDALLTRGFLVKYVADGREYGLVPSFSKHQFINNREQDSAIPSPSAEHLNNSLSTREARVEDASSTGTIPSPSLRTYPLRSKVDRVAPQQIVDAWNAIASPIKLGIVKSITPARKTAMMARLKDAGSFEELIKVFERVAASSFCRGEINGNGHGNWQADFDFVLRESSFTKIVEGKYDDRKKGNGHAITPEKSTRQLKNPAFGSPAWEAEQKEINKPLVAPERLAAK